MPPGRSGRIPGRSHPPNMLDVVSQSPAPGEYALSGKAAMKVLMTGHKGYIGSVMAPMFRLAGHKVMGLDNYLFEGCTFGECPPEIPARRVDLRDVQRADVEGFDAVVHLAALSNDPLGNFNPQCTYDINHVASVRLARLAKKAGVPRFLYASSCSLYGVASDAPVAEEA